MTSTLASAYFRNTTLQEAWARYSEQQKASAVSEAKALFESELGRTFSDSVQAECEAVYEQALYMLQMNTTPSGSGSATPTLNGTGADSATPMQSDKKYGIWSPRALRKFGAVRAITRLA